MEANQVIWMRMVAIGQFGPDIMTEMSLMMSEKVEANASALASLASGNSADSVVTAYREIVQANLKRLSA
ncbi:hypothetical protein ASG54_05190 [Aureimonas sp. Leaf460]|nr:hypothetical protein ASG54_05190 [Aureimonas sp. Leaf460]KQT69283.1 hypothetical protein ASG62_17800 [Aureimonas sp. Leaf427]